MLTHVDEMRQFIDMSREERIRVLCESYLDLPQEPMPEMEVPSVDQEIIADLNEVMEKLQSYQEFSEDQTYAMGVEVGLQMAAEMIEQVIRRYSGE